MTNTIYENNTYLDVLIFLNNRDMSSKYSVTELSEAAQCQRSHMSRVLSGKIDLTLEQANGLCDFFSLSNYESEFFLLLVQYSRAGTLSLRKKINFAIQKIRNRQKEILHKLNKIEISIDSYATTYYSAWYWSAIHILVSIPKFQTIQNISKRLYLDEELVRHCLQNLEKMGLVKSSGFGKWSFTGNDIHLPRQSPLSSIHQGNWKNRSILAAQNPFDDGVHYSVVQSISLSDYERAKNMILNAINDFSNLALPSKEEELICFTCDIFKV